MAILKNNLINGEKPVFGNPKHIAFVKKIQGIMSGELPIITEDDFEGICFGGNDYMNCAINCWCSKSMASFECINCGTTHKVIASERIIPSPIKCKCGFTYSEKDDEFADNYFLINNGTIEDHL